MNIILFDADEIGAPISRTDRRIVHIFDVLRRKVGDAIDVGLVNGPRGKAVLTSATDDWVEFEFQWYQAPPGLLRIDLIVGLARPQTCRKILQEATSLGVSRILLVASDRGETSYAQSKLWTTDQWKSLVRAGVEQAFTTRFPAVEFGLTLNEAIALTSSADRKICLDNYEATVGVSNAVGDANSVVLVVGAERGWTQRERALFIAHRFTMAHLGPRPLRTETATIASISIVASKLQENDLPQEN